MVKDWQAPIIKIAAVLSALTRWIGALVAAEGFDIIDAWATWWIPLSALMAFAMAVVEAWALSYIFNAWKQDKSRLLLVMALVSSATFIAVLAPYIAAQVQDVPLGAILQSNFALWGWSVAVAASTITIVISVGLAEQRLVIVWEEQQELKAPPDYVTPTRDQVMVGGACFCSQWCTTQEGYDTHLREHYAEITGSPSVNRAVSDLRRRYLYTWDSAYWPPPTAAEIAQIRLEATLALSGKH